MNHGATLLHLRGTAGKDAIYRKISWRLLPLLMLCYMVACLDRINIGYAQAQMKVSLDFGDGVQLWGAAIFFIGYCLFQVPCNLLLEKIGAGKMLLRVMLFWGVTASAGALVRTPFEFYAIRFLLGVCEAGLFPGVILYLTYWYPAARRARVIAVFASAALIAGLLGGPLSTIAQQVLHQQNGLQAGNGCC
jgi:MFS family permease